LLKPANRQSKGTRRTALDRMKMREVPKNRPNLHIKQAEAVDLVLEPIEHAQRHAGYPSKPDATSKQ